VTGDIGDLPAALPGLVAQQDGVTMAVYAFEIAGEKITRIWAILDPGKLRPWATA